MDADIVSFLLFLFLSFFCSGSETSMFSLNQVTLEDVRNKYPKRGGIIHYLLSEPQRLLLTILICNIFANIFATLIANKLFDRYFPSFPGVGRVIVMTLVILIFGETTPKSIAIYYNKRISLLVSPVFFILSKLFTPVIFVMNRVATAMVNVHSFLLFKNAKEEIYYRSEEMLEVVKSSKNLGIIEEVESDILKNIIEFTDTSIWKIMRPRDEIFSLSIDTLVSDCIKLIQEKKYSRIPVWKDNEENIIGILYSKEILRFSTSTKKLSAHRKYLRDPIFVPETTSAEKLLDMFRTTNSHLAVVIDEYGGVSGLVTLEDVLETILGDVVDKDDVVPLYYRYNADMIEIQARMDLYDFNSVFETDLKSDEAATVGGYLIEKIKRIPKNGELFIFDNLQFKIAGAFPNKIDKIMITKMRKIPDKKARLR